MKPPFNRPSTAFISGKKDMKRVMLGLGKKKISIYLLKKTKKQTK